MLFEWDPKKNDSNIRKHKISFELAAAVFDDRFHLSILDQRFRREERWVTIGRAATNITLVVVHTYQEQDGQENVRVISARRATKKEKKQYEEGI